MLYYKIVSDNETVLETVEYYLGDIKKNNETEKIVYSRDLLRMVNARVLVQGEENRIIDFSYPAFSHILEMLSKLTNFANGMKEKVERDPSYIDSISDVTPTLIDLNATGDKLFLQSLYQCNNNGFHFNFIIISNDEEHTKLSFTDKTVVELETFFQNVWRELQELTFSVNEYQGMSGREVQSTHSKARDLILTIKKKDELTELIDEGIIDTTGDISNDSTGSLDLFMGLLDDEGNYLGE